MVPGARQVGSEVPRSRRSPAIHPTAPVAEIVAAFAEQDDGMPRSVRAGDGGGYEALREGTCTQPVCSIARGWT